MTASRSPLVILPILAFPLLALNVGCDDGIRGSETPKLTVVPPNFQFPKLAAGESADSTVVLQNDGSGELLIAEIKWQVGGDQEFQLFWVNPQDGEQYQAISKDGTDQLESQNRYPLAIGGGESMDLVLNYAPTDNDPDPGRIVLVTNTAEEEVDVPVLISGVAAEINVAPRTVDFGRVPASEEKTEVVTVSNVGQVSLLIEQILPNGSQDFVPLINGKDPRRQAEVLEDPDGDGETGLAAGSSFQIEVRYAPQIEGPDSAELSII